jgi:hypothetical protein
MPPLPQRLRSAAFPAFALAICASLTGCRSAQAGSGPSIEFTRVPPAGDGSPDKLERIEGRIKGARPGERIVLFALSGVWWVQPQATEPFTAVQSDASWRNSTHPGSAYAALLVDSRYRPPLTVNALPEKGGPVLAIATVAGVAATSPAPVPIRFSGYQWEVHNTGTDHGGTRNPYTPANAWTDKEGGLHLRVSRQGDQWASAEVKLSRSLGYGSYRFVVRDVSHFEPAAVFAIFTWDDNGPPREVDIEISRWGEPEDKNAQYVVQPYVVPANTVRFSAPTGVLTHWIDWQPGRVLFKTVRGFRPDNRPGDVVSEHVFTSGVPSAGNERIHMNLYAYGNNRRPLQHEFEIVIEKFEFLP